MVVVLLWHSGLSIRDCDCSGLGHCCGMDFLAQELLHATSEARTEQNKTKQNKKQLT